MFDLLQGLWIHHIRRSFKRRQSISPREPRIGRQKGEQMNKFNN